MIYVLLAYISYPLVFLMSKLSGPRFSLPLEGVQPPRVLSGGRARAGGAQGESFVVFQTAKLGDMICSTPVFREIKRAYPASRLGVVIHPATRPLLKHNPHIDEIIEFDPRLYRGVAGKIRFAFALGKRGYSSALILMPNAANILAAFWALIPKRVCVYPNFTGPTLRRLLALNTHLEYHGEGRMSMETYLGALRQFGIKNCGMQKEVYAPKEADAKAAAYLKGDGPFAGVAPGTANVMKEWGREKFLELSKRISDETTATVVVIGSEKERAAGEEIVGACRASGGRRRAINACGAFSLEEAPALLKRLSVVIGVDTALIYMADALDVPAVDIAGPCDMNDQRPIGKGSVIIQKKSLPCVPCSHTFRVPYECREGHRSCVADVTVEEVFSAAVKIIQ
ncbi:MAG: glycosyltransferase family 9 protein [Deltaproteobacteria bacterium]|nr:glycosyltransferase family 9 protein [Deltaproteobacteria bacterium]